MQIPSNHIFWLIDSDKEITKYVYIKYYLKVSVHIAPQCFPPLLERETISDFLFDSLNEELWVEGGGQKRKLW